MALDLYRPRQGVYARAAAGAALTLLVLFASIRVYQMAPVSGNFPFLGLTFPNTVWPAAGVFLALGAIVALFTTGARTGVGAIDSKTAGFVQLLSETETELQKVSWPSKDELTNSTAVVLACMAILGLFLFCVDQFVGWFMGVLKVLPIYQ